LKRNSRGFTLVELLIVLALMSVLLTMAVPTFNRVYENIKLNADAQQMASVLRLARQEAVYSGQAKIVVFYTQSTKYKFIGKSSYWFNSGVNYAGSTTFTTRYANKPACIFNPSGAPSGGGTVTIENSSNVKRYIIVNPVAGRVRVSEEPPW